MTGGVGGGESRGSSLSRLAAKRYNETVNNNDILTLINRAGESSWERSALIGALVRCLSSKSACDALSLDKYMLPEFRRALLRKIREDIEETTPQKCHIDIVDRLIELFPLLPARRREGCAYCLAELYEALPQNIRSKIVSFFLKSKWVTLRRRGYKKAKQSWHVSYSGLIENAWKEHYDAECAQVIIEHFPTEYIKREKSEILKCVDSSRIASKLFLRFEPSTVEGLKDLLSIDEISYAYLRYKWELPFTVNEAASFLERNATDEKVGLLLWVFGKMGLSDVLKIAVDNAEVYQQQKFEAILGHSLEQLEKGS